MELLIEPLSNQHDCAAFDCGEPSLNEYLHRYASQDIKRRGNRVFVASPGDLPQQVTGYYVLVAFRDRPNYAAYLGLKRYLVI